MDREAEARAIVQAARQARRPLPRWLWVVAMVTSLAAVAALAVALWQSSDAVSDHPLERHVAEHSSGLGLGLLLGVGLGIAIGAIVALRRKRD